jgi:hypothetical protein
MAMLSVVGLSSGVRAQDANRVETEHLYIEWVDGTSDAEVSAAKVEGERFYVAVRDFLGQAPEGRIIIMLQGPSEQPDGRRLTPRVDGFGRIQLYKFDPSGQTYFGALPHEMVHAFRFDRHLTADWFFEEGFAEMVALRVDSSLAGFPWFDYPVAVVAGQWVANGEDIPLSDLRERHRELNGRCRAQAYSLRASFFCHLGDTHGDSLVIAMADQNPAGEPADYARFFTQDFAALETEWRAAALSAYEGIENAAELARRYRTESPVQYIPVCNDE